MELKDRRIDIKKTRAGFVTIMHILEIAKQIVWSDESIFAFSWFEEIQKVT